MTGGISAVAGAFGKSQDGGQGKQLAEARDLVARNNHTALDEGDQYQKQVVELVKQRNQERRQRAIMQRSAFGVG